MAVGCDCKLLVMLCLDVRMLQLPLCGMAACQAYWNLKQSPRFACQDPSFEDLAQTEHCTLMMSPHQGCILLCNLVPELQGNTSWHCWSAVKENTLYRSRTLAATPWTAAC